METKPKLLFMTSRFPFPLEKGDKLRAYYLIKGLSKHYEVHLISLTDEPISDVWKSELRPYTETIHIYTLKRWGIFFRLGCNVVLELPFQLAYFTDYFTKARVTKILHTVKPDHIFCQMIRPAEYVKHYHHCHKTLDYMDILSIGMERRKMQLKGMRRWIFSTEAQRLKEYEQRIFNYFEFHLMISQQDADGMPHPQRNAIQVIPNGICNRSFQPIEDVAPDHELVFVGNLSYAPNIDAIHWLCDKVLRKRKDLKLLIAGAHLGQKLNAYCKRFENVTMLGWQDNIQQIYARGKVFVAPMQIGTGLQNKVLEALSMQLPCIVSNLAASAIPNSPLIVANEPDEFIQAIDRLLNFPEEASQLGEKGRKFVEDHYSWETTTNRIYDLIHQH